MLNHLYKLLVIQIQYFRHRKPVQCRFVIFSYMLLALIKDRKNEKKKKTHTHCSPCLPSSGVFFPEGALRRALVATDKDKTQSQPHIT